MDFVEYFAIGSMMNPTSLKMRGLNPLKSRPGILRDYELIFVMAHGMAAARKVDSVPNDSKKSIHGVLHQVSRAEMDILSKSESTYVKEEKVIIQTYRSVKDRTDSDVSKDMEKLSDINECEKVEALVYVLNNDIVATDPERFSENPPSERYIDILKDGAHYHGLDEMYIKDMFMNIKVIPRPKKSQLRKVPLPQNFFDDDFPTCKMGSPSKVQYGKDQFKDYLYVSINEKMCRTKIDKSWRCYNLLQPLANKNISGVYLAATKYWYEPKYGLPDSYEKMSQEHREQMEHIMVTSFMSGDEEKRWEVVARIV